MPSQVKPTGARFSAAVSVGATIEVARLPLSRAAHTALAAEPTLIETILTGGDDFEVLASVSADKLDALRQAARRVGVTISEIGRCTRARGDARFVDAQGRERPWTTAPGRASLRR